MNLEQVELPAGHRDITEEETRGVRGARLHASLNRVRRDVFVSTSVVLVDDEANERSNR